MKSTITTDLERDLLSLLFSAKYKDMTLDQIRTLAAGYVFPESTKKWERFENGGRDETPRLEGR